jgi:hypothetical protein
MMSRWAAGPWRLFLACLCCGLPRAQAWMDFGHMEVAQIAYLEISDSERWHINKVLGYWEISYPDMSDLVSSSVWADHIKCNQAHDGDKPGRTCLGMPANALNAFNRWHYTDLPYNPDKMSDVPTGPSTPSAVWALAEAISTFRYSQNSFSCNLMLRFAIHLVGDMHQPCHNVNLYSEGGRLGNFPFGDRGCTLVEVKKGKGTEGRAAGYWRNLHELWDEAAGLFGYEWPLSGEEKGELLRIAQEARNELPKKAFPQYNASDLVGCLETSCVEVFERWSREAHELAVTEVYGHGITEGKHESPSPEYMENVKKVARRQVVLAGYRLADLLKVIAPELIMPRAPMGAQEDDTDSSEGDVPGFDTSKILLSAACLLQSIAIAALSLALCRMQSKGSREIFLLQD